MDQQAFFSAVDEVLTGYVLDPDTSDIVPFGSLSLPAKVQYAWPHPTRPILYVACSSAGPRVRSDLNCLVGLQIDEGGGIHPIGDPVDLPVRAVHICIHPSGRFLFAAHNFQEGGLSVISLDNTGRPGAQIAQSEALDFGIYPHQVRVSPSGRTVLIVDRGIDARDGANERPGAMRSFVFNNGQLSSKQVVAPGGGYGFGPRHVDFHPVNPWLYVSDERRNRLMMFDFTEDVLAETPAYTCDLLERPEEPLLRQLGGPIHVHPDGTFVYVANRADQTEEYEGRPVFAGGENSIAVFRVDPDTGEPVTFQHARTRTFHVRTFSIDARGRSLVAASVKSMDLRDGATIETVPATLSLFRIRPDGHLELHGKRVIATDDGQLQYWAGYMPVRSEPPENFD